MRRSDALSLDRRPQSPTFPNRFLSVIVVGARQCGQGQQIQDEQRGNGLTSENAGRVLYASPRSSRDRQPQRIRRCSPSDSKQSDKGPTNASLRISAPSCTVLPLTCARPALWIE